MMRILLVVAVAISTEACSREPMTCEQLVGEAAACDLTPNRVRCDGIAPSAYTRLTNDVRDQQCKGFRTETGEITPSACTVFGWDCPERLLPRAPETGTPKHPVLFVGGVDARDDFSWNEAMLGAVQRESGAVVRVIRLRSWGTRAERSAQLAEQIELARRVLLVDQVNLICYAVGGLDCRRVASAQGGRGAASIASITTIATPHHGTEVATAALNISTDAARSATLRTFLIGSAAESLSREELDVVVSELTLSGVEKFNSLYADDRRVFIQSFAAVSFPLGQAWLPSRDEVRRACDGGSKVLYDWTTLSSLADAMSEPLLATTLFASRAATAGGQASITPNDGMVSISSARWGEFRGCVPADHYDVAGQFGDEGPDARTGFDSVRFYTGVLRDLAERGF